MGVHDQDTTDTSSFVSTKAMRAYSDSSDLHSSYPWEREKRDDFYRGWGREKWNKDFSKDKAQMMNGPTTKRSPCKKYISVVSEGNYFIASKAPLPDRIELRMCGTAGVSQKHRSVSIPDLYRIKMKPIPEAVEDIVDAVRREDVQSEGLCPIHDHHSPRNSDLKEMYVSQYTHHFDPTEPRSHIAGWKVDIEPNGIPHRRSRMCVLNNPVVSGSRKRPERPKSAPPTLAYEFDLLEQSIEDDRLSSATLPTFHRGYPESVQSTDDLSTRLKDLIVDSAPPEFINDDSSFGYDPSDDTSETSSAFNQDPYKKRDPAKFNYSRPRLIRLSADFPGVRNLEKMRRKRQSMGSSSTGSMSSPSPSPRSAGEYGFFVALTSKDQIPKQRHGRYYSMT